VHEPSGEVAITTGTELLPALDEARRALKGEMA
jgi:hypothetical protein